MTEELNELYVEEINSKGYGIIPKLLMQDKDITIEGKAIYAYFCSYAGGGSNQAFPSVETICQDLGITKIRYRKHRQILIDKGYVTILKKKDKNGKHTKNLYRLNQVISNQKDTVSNQYGIKTIPYQNDTTNNNSSLNNNKNNNNNNNNEIITQVTELLKTKQYAPRFIKLTDKRKKAILARIKEHDLDTVIRAINMIDECEQFIDAINEKKSWYNIDFIFNPNKFVKLLEGAYLKRIVKSGYQHKQQQVTQPPQKVFDPNSLFD